MERSAAPEQGVLFAYAVVLAVAAAVLVDLRFDGEWAIGVRLAIYVAVIAMALGLAARGRRPVEPETSGSTMAVAALVPTFLALGHIAQVLGAENQVGDDLVWIAPVFAGLAGAVAVYFRARAAALLAALSGAGSVFAFVAIVIEPDDAETLYRWIAAGIAAALIAAGVTLRARGERRHSAQLVNAAGLILIGLAWAVGFVLVFDEHAEFGAEREWEVVLVAGSLLVIACAIAFRERGTGWVGAIALGIVVFGVSGQSDESPSFVGWPLFLAVGALLFLLAALLKPAARR